MYQDKLIVAHFNESEGLPSNDVYSLLQDESGRIWAGTSQGLVWITDNFIQSVDSVTNIPIHVLTLDTQNRVLIGSGQGLYRAEQDGIHVIHPELSKYAIISLLEEANGDLWLGTSNHGLLRVSSLGLEQLEVSQGLPDQRVTALLQDQEASIWVGTHAGLMRLRKVPFNTLTEQQGLAGNYVRTVLAHSDGSMWVGSSTGLTHIKNERAQALVITMADGNSPSVLSLAEGVAGELWVGTFSHGLLRLVHGEVLDIYDSRQGLASNEVPALEVSPDGSIWIGTTSKLHQLKAGEIKTFPLHSGALNNFIMGLHQTSTGDVWVATSKNAAIIRDRQVIAVDLHHLDGATYVFGFYSEPNGQYVWMGTDRGLVRYRYADASLALIGVKQGLPVEKLFQPIADQHDGLWLASSKGITRLSLSQAHKVADGIQDNIEFEHFNERDGMASRQANGGVGPSVALDGRDRIWVATALGIATAESERLSAFAHNSFPVLIEGLQVLGESVPLNSSILLAPDSKQLQFSYAGLGFVMPERIQYRTKLDGFDGDWVDRGTQNTAEYTNLAPGDYNFRVKATYSYKDWDEHEVSVAFTVLPFIWQRPGFWLLMGVILAASLWLLMRLRLKLLLARTQELARQVDEKTAELQRQVQAFEHQARVDSLTNLPNRRAFDEALTQAFIRAKRTELPITLVIIDIDYFKHVNDTWSHSVGDQVLKIVASLIRQEIRAVDYSARWGGEEFTVLLADTHIEDALPICERLRIAVMNYDYSLIDTKFKLTISLGVAQSPSGSLACLTPQELLASADQALYQAKRYGRNRVVAFNNKNAEGE